MQVYGHTGLVQGWYRAGTRLVQGWYKAGTGVVQGWYRDATRLIQGWYRAGILASPCSLWHTTSFMPGPSAWQAKTKHTVAGWDLGRQAAKSRV